MIQRIVRLLLVVMLAASAVMAFADAGPELLPEMVEATLAEKGVRVTLETYFDCQRTSGTAYEKIASGSRAWIALAEKMIAVSDACYTEGIQASLGEAMRRAPRRVLPLVGKMPVLAPEYVCLPFISAEQPVAAQLQDLRASRRAIAAVRMPRLSNQRAACLRFIDGVEAGLRSPPSQP